MANRGMDYLLSEDKVAVEKQLLVPTKPVLKALARVAFAIARHDLPSLDERYKQKRYGLGGEEFEIIKASSLLITNKDAETADTKNQLVMKGVLDDRAPLLSQLSRLFGLDEAPQIENVLNGDMYVVGGYRAVATQEREDYRRADRHLFDDFIEHCDATKPAIFSPDGIYGHSQIEFDDRIRRQRMRLSMGYFENSTAHGDRLMLVKAPLAVVAANVNLGRLVAEETFGSREAA